MSTTIDTLMNEVREAMLNNDSQTARRLLRQITRQDPDNFRAWLWLAGVTDAPSASLQYVKRAKALAPTDERVARALAWAEARMDDSSADNRNVARMVAANKFDSEAEIEEVKKPATGWRRRLGMN